MKKVKLRWLVLILVFSIGIVSPLLSGCSGSGSESVTASSSTEATASDTTATTSTTDTSSTNPYSGDGTVSGKIDLSSLSASDSTFLSSSLSAKPSGYSKVSADSGRRYEVTGSDIVDSTTSVVKLYVIDSKGELEDTGITGAMSTNADGDAEFSFAGVKDDINYIVRYLKIVNGSAIEVKANAYIPKGKTAPTSEITVSPQSSIVVETLVSAILDATQGTGIEQETVNVIIDSVKTAIETLVTSGAIQIPSMIVEVDAGDIDALLTEDVKNDSLSNTSGLLLSDPSVDSELGVAKAASQASLFDLASVTTAEQKRALLKKVFDELLGDGDVPSFMLDFFGDVYVENVEKSVLELMDAIINGLEFSGSSLNVTAPGGIAAFTAELTSVYALVDKKNAGTLTPDDKTALSEVPPVILGLFSRELVDNISASSGTSLNIPQGLAFTIYIVDGYIKDTLGGTDGIVASAGSGSGVSYQKEDFVDFNPMAPGSLMEILGFNTRVADYAGLSVEHLWIHPGRIWLDNIATGSGQEVDMLSAGACISDVMGMVDPTAPDLSAATAELRYPKADGTIGTISLVEESTLPNNGSGSGPGDPGSACFVVDPWRESDPNIQPFQPDTSRVVSDFASGDYTVSVTFDGETITRTYAKKVITGMSKVFPTLVSPLAWPNWPGDSSSQAERDAFDVAMTAYNLKGATRYSANVDTDSDGVNDAAKVTITWTAPDVTLPEGVKMGYSLDVGKGECNPKCKWEQFYSTWERDKILFVTAFTLPVNLVKYDNIPYQVNINAVFIDTATGEELGQGGHAHAEFWVADPVAPDATFTITGNADALYADALYKVVLFKETYNPDDTGNQHTRTAIAESSVVNGAYLLTPLLSDFADAGAWYGIVMYQDTDGSGDFSDNDMEVWPKGENMWFDTWGGTLRIGKESCVDGVCNQTDKTIFGDETITGPSWVTLDPTQTFTISGTATDGQNIVLFKETWNQATNTSTLVVIKDVAVVAGEYSMSPAIVGDFTSTPDAWFRFVMYTNTGQQTFDPDVDTYTDPAAGVNVYFDAWGGKLKYVMDDCSSGTTANFNCAHSELGIVGGETVTGPAF